MLPANSQSFVHFLHIQYDAVYSMMQYIDISSPLCKSICSIGEALKGQMIINFSVSDDDEMMS